MFINSSYNLPEIKGIGLGNGYFSSETQEESLS